MNNYENNKLQSDKSETKKNLKKFFKNGSFDWNWPIKIFFITLMLSLVFSIGSELILTASGLVISIIVILVLWLVSVIFDMLGVAVAASALEPFVAMASKRVRGSKEAISLVKNAEKVSSFASDVVGDICGILSGAVGAALVIKIYASAGNFTEVLIAALISSVIAALTVFGKAVGKNLAINHPEKIVFTASKIINFIKIKK